MKFRKCNLKDVTSFKIGGECSKYLEPKNIQELIDILQFCKKSKYSFEVFGYGTNLLFPDQPDSSKVYISIRKILTYKFKENSIFFSAGIPLSFISFLGLILNENNKLFTFLLPGSIGAGIFINAKYKDFQISDIIDYVYFLDLNDNFLEERKISSENCSFDYKKSIFQQKNCIITGVDVHFKKIDKKISKFLDLLVSDLTNFNYSDLTSFHQHQVDSYNSLKQNNDFKNEFVEEIIRFREKTEHFKYPSCGSVFKNNYRLNLPIGMLVDELNLKGKYMNGAKISEKHGNFIYNRGNAKANDVIFLINLIKEKIKSKYRFTPELEINITD